MILDFIKSRFLKVKNALAKSGSLLGDKIRALFGKTLDEETLDKLEQILYEADLGVKTSVELKNQIRESYANNPNQTPEELLQEIRKSIVNILSKTPSELVSISPEEGPFVLLIVGVNGNGKTTSVAKLANRFKAEGKKVLIGAADTFRAAAIEQLEIWTKRLGVDLVKGASKSDPAAVVFDTMTAGKARGVDIILIDTAGRLHTKTDLMQELEKIKRSCRKINPHSPHETLLVLDATTGQNAVEQARIFHKYTPISGLILTKIDGTAKGGIVINIQQQLGIPVKFIGVGENLEDLEPFDIESFVNALFE